MQQHVVRTLDSVRRAREPCQPRAFLRDWITGSRLRTNRWILSTRLVIRVFLPPSLRLSLSFWGDKKINEKRAGPEYWIVGARIFYCLAWEIPYRNLVVMCVLYLFEKQSSENEHKNSGNNNTIRLTNWLYRSV